MNYNYRPLKSLKYVKQEDSVFGVAKVPSAVFYPGDGNVRVRWDSAQIREYEQADYDAVFRHAVPSVKQEAKAVKNFLKNAITQPMMIRLIAFNRIGKTGGDYVLADKMTTRSFSEICLEWRIRHCAFRCFPMADCSGIRYFSAPFTITGRTGGSWCSHSVSSRMIRSCASCTNKYNT